MAHLKQWIGASILRSLISKSTKTLSHWAPCTLRRRLVCMYQNVKLYTSAEFAHIELRAAKQRDNLSCFSQQEHQMSRSSTAWNLSNSDGWGRGGLGWGDLQTQLYRFPLTLRPRPRQRVHDTLQASTFTLLLLLSFVLGVGLQGQRAETRGQGEDWDQGE